MRGGLPGHRQQGPAPRHGHGLTIRRKIIIINVLMKIIRPIRVLTRPRDRESWVERFPELRVLREDPSRNEKLLESNLPNSRFLVCSLGVASPSPRTMGGVADHCSVTRPTSFMSPKTEGIPIGTCFHVRAGESKTRNSSVGCRR